MMFVSLVILLAANIIFAYGQDCGQSKLFLDPGQTGINATQTTNGYYLTPFPMPVTIYNNTGNMLHVSVYKDTMTCFDVSGEPNCVYDLRVVPNHLAVSAPPINVGTVYYRHTTDENELTNLADYLCPGFKARQAVVITYFCLAESHQPNNPALTVQVILTVGEDRDGINRTVLLINFALLWQENGGSFVEVGTKPYFSYYYKYTNDTLGFDVTYLNGWDSSPQQVPEIPQTCPVPTTVKCEIKSNAQVVLFDGTEQNLTSGKLTLAVWNPGNTSCKFKWVARIKNNQLVWAKFSVGPHKRATKFLRTIKFNKAKGTITQSGWKCGEGCKGEITTFDYDIVDNGIVYATVREVDPNNTYVIDSELCSDADEPNYKFTFHFNAAADEVVASLELSKQFYDANKDDMDGLCLP